MFKIVIAFVISNGPFVSHIDAPTYPKYFPTQAACEEVLDNPDFKADISALADRVRFRTKTNAVIVTTHCVPTEKNDTPDPLRATPPKLPDTRQDFRG